MLELDVEDFQKSTAESRLRNDHVVGEILNIKFPCQEQGESRDAQ